MLVTLNFEKNGTKYRVERGRGPNVLKFFIEDPRTRNYRRPKQGDSPKTQETIDDLLQMSLQCLSIWLH